MPYKPVFPPFPVNEAAIRRTLTEIREVVIQFTSGSKDDPLAKAVTISDLVKLGLITKDQAEELAKN